MGAAQILVGFYYLDYPDCAPDDPTDAATDLWVDVGEEGDTPQHFGGCYQLYAMTYRFFEREYVAAAEPFVGGNVLIVPTLDDTWMEAYLSAHIDDIVRCGELH